MLFSKETRLVLHSCHCGPSDCAPALVETYPYHFFLREKSDFSLLFNLHGLVSPFWLLIFGRTYGTYLRYERTYTTKVPTLKIFFYSAGRDPRARFGLLPKKKSAYNRGDFSPRWRGFFSAIVGIFPVIAGIFPRDCGDFFPQISPTKMTLGLTVMESQLR